MFSDFMTLINKLHSVFIITTEQIFVGLIVEQLPHILFPVDICPQS